ncbi:MAG: STAS domain-containing protein [Myxococcaceae bacterium]|nr:STAS domain-containing protein [Myxococcaceae bacterium]
MDVGTVMEGTCVSADQRVTTVVLEGELSLDDLRKVGEELFRLALKGHKNVVLDLSQVSHVDYRGLRPLAARAEMFRAAGGDVRIAGLSGYLMHIFRAAGTHDAFQFFAETENARQSFAA